MRMTIEKKIVSLRGQYRNYVDARCSRLVETDKTKPVVCLNCATEYVGAYCPSCGQSARTKRFSTRETLVHIFSMLIKFDSAFWRTTVELFSRPGYMVRDYLEGRRMGYMRPLQMLLCLITIYLIVKGLLFDGAPESELFDSDIPFFKQLMENETIKIIYQNVNAFRHNMIASTLSSIFLLSLVCFLFFRKTKEGRKLNYAEHFYTLIFINCQIVIMLFIMLGYHIVSGTYPTDSVNFFVVILLGVIMYSQLTSMKWLKAVWVFLLAYLFYLLILILSILVLLVCMMWIFGFENVDKLINT